MSLGEGQAEDVAGGISQDKEKQEPVAGRMEGQDGVEQTEVNRQKEVLREGGDPPISSLIWQKKPVEEEFKEDTDRKKAALAACVKEHEELVECLRTSHMFKSCWYPQRAFWTCYEKQRGVRGNVLFPSFSQHVDSDPDTKIAKETSAGSDDQSTHS